MSPRKKLKRTVAAKRVRRNSCQALLVIDNEPIRRKALRDCRTALRQRDKARLEWEHFDRTDRPAFEQWLHHEFGAQLTRLRECGQAIFEAENLIRTVEIEAGMRGISCWDAYDRVMRAREAPPADNEIGEDEDCDGVDDEEEWEDEDDFCNPFDHPETDDPFGGLEDDFKSFMRGIFGCDEEEAEEVFERLRGRAAPLARSAPEACVRIKEVYRTLVRRLHPDMIEQVDTVRQDLWHAVQEAYRMRDLDRLESLLARCDMEEGVISESTAISQLRRSWREIKNAVNSLRRQIRHAREDTAWGFSSQTPEERSALRIRIKDELRNELRDQTDLHDELKEEIARWEERRQNRLREQASSKVSPVMVASARNTDGRPKKRKRRDSPGDNPFQGEFAF